MHKSFVFVLAGLLAACAPSGDAGSGNPNTEDAAPNGADSGADTGEGSALEGDSAGADAAASAEGSDMAAESRYEAGLDLSGYYLPEDEVRFGDWALAHVWVGMPFEFDAHAEADGAAETAPVWMSFDDVTAGTVMTELGEAAAVQRRVRATRYVIESGEFTIEASDEVLGDILLSGQIDPDARGDSPVEAFRGGLEMGGDRIRNLTLYHWYGD